MFFPECLSTNLITIFMFSKEKGKLYFFTDGIIRGKLSFSLSLSHTHPHTPWFSTNTETGLKANIGNYYVFLICN